MDKLLVFPFNGNGIEALDCVGDQYEVIGFIDDTQTKQGIILYGIEVFSRDAISRYKECKILAIPGNPHNYSLRAGIINGLNVPAERFATVIHPRAVISANAKIGRNVLIMAGVVLTSNAVISDHVCILPNSVVHHDSIVGSWTLIGSNVTIAGHVEIGDSCYIGSCSSLIDNITVGSGSLLGIGTNLIKSIPENSRVVGNPGRSL